LFDKDRLVGSVSYYNGEAAFLLIPFRVGIYLAGSCLVNPALRGLVLAGVLCSMEVVVLMQSRGAMVATAVSLPVFLVFLSSGQRLRSLLTLAPVVAALFIVSPRHCLSKAQQRLRGISNREISGLSNRSRRFLRPDDRHRDEALRLGLEAR
jgi:hypothetical protein